ncbi:MAG: hypothetical protein KDE53_09245, partial [Caldilineaceae bacterium]|nr:hypothetical protein [Caldilineaceae bacterium]
LQFACLFYLLVFHTRDHGFALRMGIKKRTAGAVCPRRLFAIGKSFTLNDEASIRKISGHGSPINLLGGIAKSCVADRYAQRRSDNLHNSEHTTAIDACTSGRLRLCDIG